MTLASQIKAACKSNGIKVKARMYGQNEVSVSVPVYGDEFVADEIRAFCQIAKDMGATFVRGTEINPDHEALLTGKHQWMFVF